MRFTAVITVTSYEEDCSNALRSIRKNPNYFQREIFIVCKNLAAVKQFQSENVTIIPEFKLSDLGEEHTTIMKIPPYALFGESGLIKLKTKIKHSSIEKNVFTLRTAYYSQPPSGLMWLNGFALVALVCQWLHSFWEFWKIHQTDDIVVYCVVNKMGKRSIHPEKNYFTDRFFHNNEPTYVYDEFTIVKYPSDNYRFLFRFLSQHSHFGLGWWILLYAFYWIGFLFLTILPIISNVIAGSSFNFYIMVFGLIILQACLVMIATNGYALFPLRFLLSVGFTFYFMLFPIVLVIAKLYVPPKTY